MKSGCATNALKRGYCCEKHGGKDGFSGVPNCMTPLDPPKVFEPCTASMAFRGVWCRALLQKKKCWSTQPPSNPFFFTPLSTSRPFFLFQAPLFSPCSAADKKIPILLSSPHVTPCDTHLLRGVNLEHLLRSTFAMYSFFSHRNIYSVANRSSQLRSFL